MVYSENANNIISQKSIADYFKKENLAHINDIDLKKIDYIGTREDNSKPLLLPSDWDDGEDYSIYLKNGNM